MNQISTFDDFVKYLRSKPRINVCWYGPRSADVSGLESLINIDGLVSCYGKNEFDKSIPFLTGDLENKRERCSSDDLASVLLQRHVLKEFIINNKINAILPYDSNADLENLCSSLRIDYFSSSDKLKDVLRDKTNIDEISEEIKLQKIPGTTGKIDDFDYSSMVEKYGLPLFLHFAEGAGGSGNYIVRTHTEFEEVKKIKKGRRLNVKKFVEGRSCSIDICVTATSTICGVLEEMLIGASPLSSNPTEYVASSWFENNYSRSVRQKIRKIGEDLGDLLRSKGFLGFFHPDFLVTGEDVYLTELNMRFGGSCGVYTKAQIAQKQIPLMVLNILSFIDPNIKLNQKYINDINLDPLNYCLINIKNNLGEPIKLNPSFRNGLYRITSKNVTINDSAASFFELKNTDECFISSIPESKNGSIIDPGALVCQIVTRSQISDSNSKLNIEGESLVEKVFSKMATRLKAYA